MSRLICLSIILFFLASCQPAAKQTIAFYYWKSVFSLNDTERSCLKNNHCQTLYLKYFDVIKEGGQIRPVAITEFRENIKQKIVAVIFIKNDVFRDADSVNIEKLAKNTLSLVDQISFSNSVTVNELQWDCDWTEKTKDAYFLFLKKIKSFFRNPISATIRLHQVKYKDITGVPPVDKGVLMYYNMNDITAGSKNSIYEKSTANKYLNALRSYPLALDIALPIFTWGIQSRDGKVVALLNKTTEAHFLKDSCFTETAPGSFLVKKACFKGGYYFSEGDNVKIDYVKQEDLLQIADDMKSNLSSWPSEIIFYDLDSLNLNHYDKTIFQKVLDRFE